VLRTAKKAMNTKEITAAAKEAKLWLPNGKTPSATLSSALQRDINDTTKVSRFKKAGRGLFDIKTN
jgi:hypothetical protein